MKKTFFTIAVTAIILSSCRATPTFTGSELPPTEQRWAEAIKPSYPKWQEPVYIEVADPKAR